MREPKRLMPLVLAVAALLFTPAHAEFDGDENAVEAAKAYAGTTLNFVFPAGLGALDAKTFSGPRFEELTGIKINVIEIPTNDIFTKILQEHRAGTGAYDVISMIPSWLPDLVASGAIESLDSYIDEHGYRAELDDIEPVFRSMMDWDGKVYSLIDDGDVLVLYYRTDLFEDPENQAEYKAKYGRELAPPKDWQEFNDIARFFTDKFAPDLYGAAIQRNPSQLHYFFQERFRNEGGKFFDAETMKATINSDIGVRVLTDMIEQNKFMPPGAEAWGPLEVMKEWLAGRLAMTIWWPPLGRWSAGFGADEEALSWVPKSTVAGKVAYASTPGGHPQLALGGATVLSVDSRNKEAAYLWMQWFNSADVTLERIQLPYSLRDPFRTSHFESEEFRSLWPSAGAYLDALRVGAKQGLPDLSIRNTFKYTDALIRGLQEALAGEDPKTVLDEVAAQWDEITRKAGVDRQLESYREWASNPAAYPGD